MNLGARLRPLVGEALKFGQEEARQGSLDPPLKWVHSASFSSSAEKSRCVNLSSCPVMTLSLSELFSCEKQGRRLGLVHKFNTNQDVRWVLMLSSFHIGDGVSYF